MVRIFKWRVFSGGIGVFSNGVFSRAGILKKVTVGGGKVGSFKVVQIIFILI